MSGLTMYRFKGETVPDTILEKILLNHTTYVGVAVASLSKDKKPTVSVVHIELAKMPDQLAGVKRLLEQFKDKDVMLHFSTQPEGFNKKEMQPIPVLYTAENGHAMVACLNGMADPIPDSMDYLTAKAQEWFQRSGMDVMKMADQLKESKTAPRELETLYENGKGSVTVLFNTDRMLHFGQESENSAETEGDWGWITGDLEGVSDDATASAAVDAMESLTDEERMLAALTGEEEKTDLPFVPDKKPDPVVQPTPEPEKKVETAPAKSPVERLKERRAQAQATKTTPPPDTGTVHTGFRVVSPPKGMRDVDVTKWVARHFKKPPENYHKLYRKGELSATIPVKDEPIKDLKTAGEVLKSTTAVPAIPAQKTATELRKEIDVPALDAETHTLVTESFLPSVKVALLDASSEDILDPALGSSFEKLRSNIAEQLGLPGLPATYHWEVADLARLGTLAPQALVLLAKWYQYNLIKAQQDLFKLRGKKTSAESTPKSAADLLRERREARKAAAA